MTAPQLPFPLPPESATPLTRARITAADARDLVDIGDPAPLMARAAALRDAGFGARVTFSRKVFVPLTRLCRDSCHYCVFAHPPRRGEAAYMTRDEVLAIARAGAAAGCDEVLFTLGDKPERRYRAARDELAALGHDSTLSYLAEVAGLVMAETGLLPHVNAGVMDAADIAALRAVSVSQGLMLETLSDRLSARGGPHFGSPDKQPAARLATIAAAGRARVPFTTGLLIGIGETRAERIEALLALRDLHDRYGHIQEVIIQNFRAKPGTRMAGAPEPPLAEQQWTIAAARLIFGAGMSIQSPPNLRADDLEALVAAGIDDWGGISPVTPDHVNPERAWPALAALASATARAGKTLAPRLAIYPGYLPRAVSAGGPGGSDAFWLDASPARAALARADGAGLAQETVWRVGRSASFPDDPSLGLFMAGPGLAAPGILGDAIGRALDRVLAGSEPAEADIAALFDARGPAAGIVMAAADALRSDLVGETVTYAVNRNINYTNVCGYRCQFCAFSKGRGQGARRGPAYDLGLDEIARRSREAWQRGATEVCLQGGIHPDYDGQTYLAILGAVRGAVPGMHVHAFSALEVRHGAETLGLPAAEYLGALKDAGLGSLPGTAAEILDDRVRAVLCADKIDTAGWLAVHRAAHRIGLPSTATMMFGHLDGYAHWARHLLELRRLQAETGGFTEFVPLPFVHMDAPIYRQGRARQGPSLREALLVHAVGRLVFGPVLRNVQVSWVKLGAEGAAAALKAGANDLGGSLMNESISRAAGTEHGQEMAPVRLRRIAAAAGRPAAQRTTLYGSPPEERIAAADTPPALSPPLNPPAGSRARANGGRDTGRRSRPTAPELTGRRG